MDVADHLKNRMEIIAEIVGSVQGPRQALLSGGGITSSAKKGLRWRGSPTRARKSCGSAERDGYGRILASNITPYGEIANRRDVDIKLGEKLIDSLTADALNFDGVVAVPITYDGTFRKLKGLEEAFDHGLTESVEISLGYSYGSEAAQNKFTAELKLGFEARPGLAPPREAQRTSRLAQPVSAPRARPGWDIRYKLDRFGQRKKLKSSGLCQVDHGIKIGKMKNGRLEGATTGEHGKTWPRWAELGFLLRGVPARHQRRWSPRPQPCDVVSETPHPSQRDRRT